MTPPPRIVTSIQGRGMLAYGDQIACYHGAHHALVLDQTVSDALGGEGWAVRRSAAFAAAHDLLSTRFEEVGVSAADERLDLAAEIFTSLGYGALSLDVAASGGAARGEELFHSSAFLDESLGRLRDKHVLDAFSAGFLGAATSLAFPSDWGTLEAEEVSCTARRDASCTFTLARRPARQRALTSLTRGSLADLGPLPDVRLSPAAARACEALARILVELSLDAQKTLRCGGRIALVPAAYTGPIAFDTLHLVEKRTPELAPVVGVLLREAAQMDAFHVLGDVLRSPSFHEIHGPPSNDPEVLVEQLIGLAAALGWGLYTAEEHAPGRTLVLTSPITPESAYYSLRHGPTVRGRLFFQQGLALAIMRLAAIDPRSDLPAYDDMIARSAGMRVEETRSPLRGDPVCEVTVESGP